MHTLTFGSGSPRVLVLPSNGMAAPVYAGLGEALAERGFTTRAVTLPGFDGVPPLPDPSWPALVEACEPLARGLGPDGVLVGHSLGGLLAAKLAETLPFRALVLLEPAITPIPALARRLAAHYRKGAIDDGRTHFVNEAPGFLRVAHPDRFPPALLDRILAIGAGTDRATLHALADGFPHVRVAFHGVRAPVTLVRAAHSGPLMHAAQWLLARRFRGRRVTVADAGHWMVGEADAALADAIVRAAAGS